MGVKWEKYPNRMEDAGSFRETVIGIRLHPCPFKVAGFGRWVRSLVLVGTRISAAVLFFRDSILGIRDPNRQSPRANLSFGCALHGMV